MAVSIKSGGANRMRKRSYTPMSEINVTPFVDVMLVLLVIFMITAPLLTVGVPVDLPKTTADNLADPDEPLVITVNAEGKVYLQETELESIDSLVPRLVAIADARRARADVRVFVRGDKTIAYGKVMEVMGRVSEAGFSKVALVVELPIPVAAPTDGAAETAQ